MGVKAGIVVIVVEKMGKRKMRRMREEEEGLGGKRMEKEEEVVVVVVVVVGNGSKRAQHQNRLRTFLSPSERCGVVVTADEAEAGSGLDTTSQHIVLGSHGEEWEEGEEEEVVAAVVVVGLYSRCSERRC